MQAGRLAPITMLALVTLLAGCTTESPTAQENAPTNGGPTSQLPSLPSNPTTLLAPETVVGGAGSSGGVVTNVPPVARALAGTATVVDNSGTFSETFTGSFFDANGEQDFIGGLLAVKVTGPTPALVTRVVTAVETTLDAEPESFDAAGWKVWSATRVDGVLHFKYRYTYALGAAPGIYTFAPTMTPNLPPAAGPEVVGTLTDSTTVEVFSEITISPTPVNVDGSASDAPWGGWSAVPGAANVESVNLVKIVNTGQKVDATIVIDFSAPAFTGADANYSIPIDGNIQFAFAEVASASVAPSTATFTYGATSSGGSVAVQFTGLQKVVYVKYRILAMPPVVASQTYSAPFTATEL